MLNGPSAFFVVDLIVHHIYTEARLKPIWRTQLPGWHYYY